MKKKYYTRAHTERPFTFARIIYFHDDEQKFDLRNLRYFLTDFYKQPKQERRRRDECSSVGGEQGEEGQGRGEMS